MWAYLVFSGCSTIWHLIYFIKKRKPALTSLCCTDTCTHAPHTLSVWSTATAAHEPLPKPLETCSRSHSIKQRARAVILTSKGCLEGRYLTNTFAICFFYEMRQNQVVPHPHRGLLIKQPVANPAESRITSLTMTHLMTPFVKVASQNSPYI